VSLPLPSDDLRMKAVDEIRRVQKLGRALDGQTKPIASSFIIADAVRGFLPTGMALAHGEIIREKDEPSSGECDLIVFSATSQPHYWNDQHTIAFVDIIQVKAVVEWERRLQLDNPKEHKRLESKLQRLSRWTPLLCVVTDGSNTDERWHVVEAELKEIMQGIKAYDLGRAGDLTRLVKDLHVASLRLTRLE
jgi:hypothetical protein